MVGIRTSRVVVEILGRANPQGLSAAATPSAISRPQKTAAATRQMELWSDTSHSCEFLAIGNHPADGSHRL